MKNGMNLVYTKEATVGFWAENFIIGLPCSIFAVITFGDLAFILKDLATSQIFRSQATT